MSLQYKRLFHMQKEEEYIYYFYDTFNKVLNSLFKKKLYKDVFYKRFVKKSRGKVTRFDLSYSFINTKASLL